MSWIALTFTLAGAWLTLRIAYPAPHPDEHSPIGYGDLPALAPHLMDALAIFAGLAVLILVFG